MLLKEFCEQTRPKTILSNTAINSQAMTDIDRVPVLDKLFRVIKGARNTAFLRRLSTRNRPPEDCLPFLIRPNLAVSVNRLKAEFVSLLRFALELFLTRTC